MIKCKLTRSSFIEWMQNIISSEINILHKHIQEQTYEIMHLKNEIKKLQKQFNAIIAKKVK